MPKKLAYHCAIKLENKVFIHGGFEWPDIPNYDTFVINLETKKWQTLPERPRCGTPPAFYKTTCTIWHETKLVVPTYDNIKRKSCTAILDLEYYKWAEVWNDNRQPTIGGQLAKYAYHTKLNYMFYIGILC